MHDVRLLQQRAARRLLESLRLQGSQERAAKAAGGFRSFVVSDVPAREDSDLHVLLWTRAKNLTQNREQIQTDTRDSGQLPAGELRTALPAQGSCSLRQRIGSKDGQGSRTRGPQRHPQ